MIDKLTYKQQLIAIIGITFLILLAAYAFTFKKTFSLKKQLKTKTELLSNLDQVKEQINNYESILAQHNSELATDEVDLQNLLYEKVTEFCSDEKTKPNLTITSFAAPHRFLLEEKSIETCCFSVKGDFKSLMLLNESLEKEMTFAQLAGAEYELIEKSKRKELIATFYVQNVHEI